MTSKDIDVIVLNSHGVGQFCNIKRLPHLGETLRAWNWRIEVDGGKGSCQAVALGKLGIKTGYIGKVGKDPWGDLGFKWMGDAGVDTTFCYQTDEVATGTGLVMIDEEGRSTIVDGDSSLEKLTVEEITAALEAMKDAKIFITGFGMPERLSLAGAKIAHSMGMTTLLNASPLPDHPMGDISYIDFLIINEVEGRLLAGVEDHDSKDFRMIIQKVKENYHCGSVVMTLGEQGSMVLHEGRIHYNQSVKVNVVDTTGAGDSFLAAFAANLIWGKTVEEASEWAGKYSAMKVTRPGTIPAFPYRDEAEAFIAELDKQAV